MKTYRKKSRRTNSMKRLMANLTIILSLTVMTFAVIGFFNSAINILDNVYSRIIILLLGVVAITSSVNYLIDIYRKRFYEARLKSDPSKKK